MERVIQFSFDVKFDDDDVYPWKPLEQVLDEACKNMGYELLGFCFSEDVTEKYTSY